ncbi:unnamed protein product [Cuscuta epithymum]|uniref:CWZF3/5/7 THD domain-containing protein n=1 Tax=Cuscuta epithymum TaxID=186058 RepID=A0AAV0FY92_9ASTE|nr:unnamed protein product [Cuscuta epithymum]
MNKINLSELRSFRVDSVSSSPLRIPGVVGANGGGSYMSGMVMKDGTWNDVHNRSLDHQEVPLGHIPSFKVNPGTVIVAEDENKVVGTLPPCNQNAFRAQILEQGEGGGWSCDLLNDNSVPTEKMFGKGSSSKPKDKVRSYKNDLDRLSDIDSLDEKPYSREKLKAGKNKFPDRSGNHSDNTLATDHSDTFLNESVKEEIHLKHADNNGRNVKADTIFGLDKGHVLVPKRGDESYKNYISGRTNGLPTSGKGKSLQPLPTFQQSILGLQKEDANLLAVDEFENDASKARDGNKFQSHSRDQPNASRHSTSILNKAHVDDASSLAQKDSSNQATASAVIEAKKLKHVADRLQSSGSSDSIGFYFQSALKFLTAASLYDSCNVDSKKQIEKAKSVQIYSDTTKLCKFCTQEYERSNDMAGAALAYKCMEAAYTHVIYHSHSIADRYGTELQKALCSPPGQSPSYIDNLNNPSAVDKGGLAKNVSPPQVDGDHTVMTRNRSNITNITRLMKFTEDVNLAMEASKNSRAAFATPNSRIGDEMSKDGISYVKRAIDFSFQDMDGLLRLVCVAMEEINR